MAVSFKSDLTTEPASVKGLPSHGIPSQAIASDTNQSEKQAAAPHVIGIMPKNYSVATQIPRKNSPEYVAYMLGIYSTVTATSLPNFRAAWINLPSNLHFTAWDKLVRTPEDAAIVEFLRFGFPSADERLFPTPVTDNHPSTRNHANDLASYLTMQDALPSVQDLIHTIKKEGHDCYLYML